MGHKYTGAPPKSNLLKFSQFSQQTFGILI